MATRRKKKVVKIKFEVSRGGIVSIGVVVFCLFLWMFLLGIWTGQSLILPASGYKKNVETVKNERVQEIPLLDNEGRIKKIYQQ